MKTNPNAVGYLFGNDIATPSQQFVDEFTKVLGVYLMSSNAKFYYHMQSAVSQRFLVNLPAIDGYWGETDPDYDSEECTYNGMKCSCSDYAKIKGGEKGVEMIKYLMAQMKSDKPFTVEFTGL